MKATNAPRILVTGGAGFLGSHLCERLLAAGAEVLCVDNFCTGSKRNILHLAGNPRFRILHHDVVQPLYVEAEEIYNLACPASPIQYQRDPVQTIKTSVYGAINMLELAKRAGATVLQASTSEIYGDPEMHPQEEGYWGRVNPIGPRACYDEGKRCAETLFFDYQRQHGVRIKVARIFNTYGPRMDPKDGRVVANFVIQALTNQKITIYGDGTQTRSFCYVADLIEGLMCLMRSPRSFTGPTNLGNDEELPIVALAELIIELTNSRSEIVLKPAPVDDPRRRKPSTRLATEQLNWRATTPLETGLRETIVYFDSVLRKERASLVPAEKSSPVVAAL